MSFDIRWIPSTDWQRRTGVHLVAVVDDADDVNEETGPLVTDSGFVPALDKLEAVNRLSRAAGGGGESLGPGSKERKSVLVTLSRALALGPDVESRSKPDLAGLAAAALDVRWDDECWSAGSTITLEGLNRLLEGALARFGDTRVDTSDTPADEARLLVDICALSLPPRMDGRSAVEEMYAAESRHWAQSEWPGFFFEHRGIGSCIEQLGGAPVPSPGRTRFDYGRNHTWDMKCHAEGDPWAILNDREAIDWALANGGLGFVLLEGQAEFDPAFALWQREFKAAHHKRPRARKVEARFARALKSSFTPVALRAIWFDDTSSWTKAMEVGAIAVFPQPHQPDGSPRRDKYKMHVARVDPWVVADKWLGN